MKPQEAINKIIETHCGPCIDQMHKVCSECMYYEALQALKKQIPKQVTGREEHYIPESYEIEYVVGECPSCKRLVYGEGWEEDFYCMNCGQLLSWGE